MFTKKNLKKSRKHRKAKPLLQRWGPKTIGVLELNTDSIPQDIVSVNVFLLYIGIKQEKGRVHMDLLTFAVALAVIITVIAMIALFTAIWIGLCKIIQAFIWIFEDWSGKL